MKKIEKSELLKEEHISEDLEKEITDYINRHYHIRYDETLEVGNEPINTINFAEAARHFANWQKQKDNLPISEDTEKAAKEYSKIERSDDTEDSYDLNTCVGFVAGAQWKGQRDEKEINEAKINEYERGLHHGKDLAKKEIIEWLSSESNFLFEVLKNGRGDLAKKYRAEIYKEVIAKLKDM